MLYRLGYASFDGYTDSDTGQLVIFDYDDEFQEVKYRVVVQCMHGPNCKDHNGVHGVAFFLPASVVARVRGGEILTEWGWQESGDGLVCPICNGRKWTPNMTPDMTDYGLSLLQRRSDVQLLVKFVKLMPCTDEQREKLFVLLERVWARCRARGWTDCHEMVCAWLWDRQDAVDGRQDYGWIDYFTGAEPEVLEKSIDYTAELARSWWEELPYPVRVYSADQMTYRNQGFLTLDESRALLREYGGMEFAENEEASLPDVNDLSGQMEEDADDDLTF
jgi:hypothetical protein